MDARHDLVRRFRAAADHRDLMAVAGGRQPGVASPAVGVNCRPRLHGFLQEGQQALGGDVLDAPKADAPDAAPALFSRHRDDGLTLDRTAPLAFFRAAHIGFVGLDLAGKVVAAGPHHGPPQLVQPGPGGLVAAEAEGTLQPQGAHPVLLAGHEPNRQEPCPQRLAGPFEYRAGGYRGLPAACPAPQPATGHCPRLADNPTVWAAKTGRPAEPADIGAASNLIPKPLVQCLEGAWVVNARHRMLYSLHPSTISVAAGGMKGIPIGVKHASSSRRRIFSKSHVAVSGRITPRAHRRATSRGCV